jgi:excisionase family DNA binding protein
MSEKINIAGYYSTAQAATLLGVSSHEVARLARAGELNAHKAVGNVLLIDAVDVRLLEALSKRKGRPFSSKVSWAALWLLSGLEVAWLDYPQTRRLNIRLKTTNAQELLWLTRKRASTKRYRAYPLAAASLRKELVLSGKSCAVLPEYGLTSLNDVLEGYALVTPEQLKERHHLIEDSAGKIIVHSLLEKHPTLNGLAQMPIAAAAADLASSLDARERRAGLDVLERLLDEYRRA